MHVIRTVAVGRPASWDETVGFRPVDGQPALIPIFSPVRRDEMLNLLDTFLAAVAEARREGAGILCYGD